MSQHHDSTRRWRHGEHMYEECGGGCWHRELEVHASVTSRSLGGQRGGRNVSKGRGLGAFHICNLPCNPSWSEGMATMAAGASHEHSRERVAASGLVRGAPMATNARRECFPRGGQASRTVPGGRFPSWRVATGSLPHDPWRQTPEVSTHIGIPLPIGPWRWSAWQETPEVSAHFRLPLPPVVARIQG